MVKFFNAKVKPEEELVSPLMADADEPSVMSSQSAGMRDEERLARRMQRESERRKRNERLTGSKAGSVSSSKSKSSKSSKTIMTQEEQDIVDVKMGCCYKFGMILVKSIHLIDGIVGLIFVVYGSLIMTQFDNPAMVAAVACLTFGSVLLFASIMGGIGFTTNVCKRIGLVFSAYTAPCVAFFYLVAIIFLLADPDAFFNYLTEYKDVLFLSSALIATLKELSVFFYFVLLGLGTMEMMR
ncbi:hypothetical protein ACHAXA_011283 [Cyclostephanos tholiformis]|uniref:Uncharacterized protein n=1 Tax=Cyclostephanos tholiformis TaxID=382380 RepID=A0ABD3RJP3_9STRA